MAGSPRRILITGGAGFLGSAIVRELGKDPPEEIRLFDRRPAASGNAILGDVRSYDAVLAACRDVDVVIHAASVVDWREASSADLEETNVAGTDNVIRACREAGVQGLVYTSTMDVAIGRAPVRGGDETAPYPQRFHSAYARTKAVAEQRVIAENSATLRTCALRPCGMYGEGDPYHVPNVLDAARKGMLKVRLGNGTAKFQHVYVGNVAHAHVLAVGQLLEPASPLPGRVYLITDHPARNFFEFMEPIVTALGVPFPPANRYVPYQLVYAVAVAAEAAARLVSPIVEFHPTLTPLAVRQTCTDMWFSGARARRELGYTPVYGEDEAVERTIDWFRAEA